MRRPNRKSVVLALAGMLTAVSAFASPGVANADPVPVLDWSPVTDASSSQYTTAPNGQITVGCAPFSRDLATYDQTGTAVRQIDRSQQIDGVPNCIMNPTVDGEGTLYGRPYGQVSGTWQYGPNLLAYDGNTLRWKYPVTCSTTSNAAIGADENIYTTTTISGNTHLIGLTPDVASGQSQPTKVMDIQVSGTCNNVTLLPYDDGIAVRTPQSGGTYQFSFYDYDGTSVGQVTGVWNAKINADGRLFSPSSNGLTLTAYDPDGQQAWSYGPISGWSISDVFPLPSGGALLSMEGSSGGALRVITSGGNADGSDVAFPSSDSQGNLFGGTRVAVDNGGKAIVVRAQYNQSQNTRATDYRVVDLASRKVVKSGGLASHYFNADEPEVLKITGNTVLFQAWSDDSEQTLYAERLMTVGFDYPRSEVLGVTAAPSPSYVALGDSFSSGEGVEPFDPDTDTTTNTCHRSDLAYANVVAQDPTVPATLAGGKFVACSGATTSDILNSDSDNEDGNGQPLPAQWESLDSNTKVVTLTIGGNDIKFTDFAVACYSSASTCSEGSDAYNTTMDLIDNTVGDDLEAVYKKILQEAPNAQVYVLGYPQIAPDKSSTDPSDNRCLYFWNSGTIGLDPNPAWADAQAARAVVTALDDKIDDTVTSVRGQTAVTNRLNLHYIDVTDVTSPFYGHTVCSDPGESYFNNIDQAGTNIAYVFHPNQRGQAAYAGLVADALKQ